MLNDKFITYVLCLGFAEGKVTASKVGLTLFVLLLYLLFFCGVAYLLFTSVKTLVVLTILLGCLCIRPVYRNWKENSDE